MWASGSQSKENAGNWPGWNGVHPLLPEVQLAIQAWINGGLGKESPVPQILTLWGAHNTPFQEVGTTRMEWAVDHIQVTEVQGMGLRWSSES